MRKVLWIVAGVLGAVGLAAWTSADMPNDAMAKLFQTPRFYQIAATGGMAMQNGTRICFGGEAMKKLAEGFKDLAKEPAAKELTKGCTTKSERGEASVSFDQVCRKSDGAASDTAMRMSITPAEIRQHFELMLPGMGPNGSDKPMISDVTMTYLGPCPETIKPGQIVMPDGKVIDPLAALSNLTDKATDSSGASPPK